MDLTEVHLEEPLPPRLAMGRSDSTQSTSVLYASSQCVADSANTLEIRIQDMLQKWMEHFDRHFEILAVNYGQAAPQQHSSNLQDLIDATVEAENNNGCISYASAASVDSNVYPSDSIATFNTAAGPRLKDSVVTTHGEGRPKSIMEKSVALQARRSVQQKMMDLHSCLATKKKSTVVHSGFGWLVHHEYFEYFISMAIITNGLFIGVQVDFAARSGDGDLLVFTIAELLFFAIFFTEFVLRVLGMKCEWASSGWNIFDAFLVLMQLIEVLVKLMDVGLKGDGAASGRILRVFRLVRICRLFRLLRFFAQIRVMIRMIVFSLDSLFWLMVLLVVMMYVVSIIFTQGVTNYVNAVGSGSEKGIFLKEYFGDIATSTLTLFKSITNGISWGIISDALFELHVVFGLIFVMFVFFVFFSVLNVVTGVFVDGAIQHAGQEREVLVAKERKNLEGVCVKLMELLVDIDVDGSGAISIDELLDCAKDATLSSYFAALQIYTPETAQLFAYLDRDGNGEIDIQEFIDGCLRIRGGARNIDLHMLLSSIASDHLRMSKRLEAKVSHLLQRFNTLQSRIGKIPVLASGQPTASKKKQQVQAEYTKDVSFHPARHSLVFRGSL